MGSWIVPRVTLLDHLSITGWDLPEKSFSASFVNFYIPESSSFSPETGYNHPPLSKEISIFNCIPLIIVGCQNEFSNKSKACWESTLHMETQREGQAVYISRYQGELNFSVLPCLSLVKKVAYKINHTHRRNSQLEHLNDYLLLFLPACKTLFSYSSLNGLC